MEWVKFAADVHRVAVEHGWYDPEPDIGSQLANLHCEVSEAWQEFRAGNANYYEIPATETAPAKPAGVAVELADVILRALDLMVWQGWPIEMLDVCTVADTLDDTYEMAAVILTLHSTISIIGDDLVEDFSLVPFELALLIGTILAWAKLAGVDMEYVLQRKHAYNMTRPYRHGGKRV